MTVISINESKQLRPDAFLAAVSFDNGPEREVAVAAPFTADEKKELTWYFEQWLNFPFIDQIRASQTVAILIHFDLHGALLNQQDYDQFIESLHEASPSTDAAPTGDVGWSPYLMAPPGHFSGEKGFLFFDGPQTAVPHPISAEEVARPGAASRPAGGQRSSPPHLGRRSRQTAAKPPHPPLHPQRLPIWQSPPRGWSSRGAGERRGRGESLNRPISQSPVPSLESPVSNLSAAETSLAMRLVEAGVQWAVGMSYSVTVTGATKFMTAFYEALLDGLRPEQALRRGRLALEANKKRRARYDQEIELEDWLLPVAFQNRPVQELKLLPDAAAEAAYYNRQRTRFPAPQPTYRFVGRDVDILNIEKHLLSSRDEEQRNLLLVRGMGGAGKATLLRHVGWWWAQTGLVDRVCYFGYDEKAHTLQQILLEIGKVLNGKDYKPQANEQDEQLHLIKQLRSHRHLLIFDNLESVTGEALAIGNTLSQEERGRLRNFLAALNGGRTLVLLGSRSNEGWLREGGNAPLSANDVYDLPGLDAGAASDLAERVLKQHKATAYRSDSDHKDAFNRLLKLLDGYPLAIEVVLSNLGRQTPGEVLAALPYDRWGEVLQEALHWGLLSPHAAGGSYLTIQPILPYLLRSRLHDETQQAGRAAVETAFHHHYNEVGEALTEAITSKEAQQRQLGQALIRLEYENLYTALRLALGGRVSFLAVFRALFKYLGLTIK